MKCNDACTLWNPALLADVSFVAHNPAGVEFVQTFECGQLVLDPTLIAPTFLSLVPVDTLGAEVFEYRSEFVRGCPGHYAGSEQLGAAPAGETCEGPGCAEHVAHIANDHRVEIEVRNLAGEQPGAEQLQLVPPPVKAALERNAFDTMQPLIGQTNKAIVKKQVLLNTIPQPVYVVVSEPVAGPVDACYGEGTQISSLRMRRAFLYSSSRSMGFGSIQSRP